MSAASYEAANNQITFAWKSLNFYVLLLISMCNATYMHPGLTYQLKTKAYYAYTCIPRSAGARRLRKTLKRCPAGAKIAQRWLVDLGRETWHTNEHSVPPACSEERRQLEPESAFWSEFASAYAAQVYSFLYVPMWLLCTCLSLFLGEC
jgi:hypothetical protein